MFTTKPTTVTGVFQAAIADVKLIQEAQLAKGTKLVKDQEIREQKFNKETTINNALREETVKEGNLASTAIDNFAKLFGMKDAT